MNTNISKFHTFAQHLKSQARKYSGALSLITILFVFTIGTAWSYVYDDQYTDLNYVSHETKKSSKNPSSAVVDMCKPLLNTHQNSSSTLSTVRNQRAVGKIAALSMMLGARFALEPKLRDDASAKKGTLAYRVKSARKPAIQSAQTIAAYRNCLKDRALAQIALAD